MDINVKHVDGTVVERMVYLVLVVERKVSRGTKDYSVPSIIVLAGIETFQVELASDTPNSFHIV